MLKKAIQRIFLIVVLLCAVCFSPAISASDDTARITKEELRSMLGKPDLVVIDVRKEKDWVSSDVKIPGAYREDRRKVDQWAQKYPQDKTIVIYCS